MIIIRWVGIILMLCQAVWMLHIHVKFMRYARMFKDNVNRFTVCQEADDINGMDALIECQKLILDAERRVHDDLLILPWKWLGRWNHDYMEKR